MAMVRQLGMPTFFFTFSSAETWWPKLISILHFEKFGHVLSFDEVSKMNLFVNYSKNPFLFIFLQICLSIVLFHYHKEG